MQSENEEQETLPIELPCAFKESAGTLHVTRGGIGKGRDRINLYAWDAIPMCQDEECPATSMCPYLREGRCRVGLTYMKAAVDVIIRNFASELDEPRLYQIGMHLLPLYRMLFKLKIEEIGVERAVTSGRYGPKANPIYKEIRETIKLLMMAWKSLGLDPTKGSIVPKENIFDIDSEDGRTYYERMEEDAKKKQTKRQKMKLLRRRK